MLLTDQPGTVTAKQLTTLHRVAFRAGLASHEDIRDACGVESLKTLSRRRASELITRFGGQALKRPPGTLRRNRYVKNPGNIRLLNDSHRNQIEALRQDLGWSHDALAGWLQRTFKVASVDELGSAQRAGHAIHALKRILARDRQASPNPQSPTPNPQPPISNSPLRSQRPLRSSSSEHSALSTEHSPMEAPF